MMSDDTNHPDNVINFPRIGFAPPPALPPTTTSSTPETEPAPALAPAGAGAIDTATGQRRSPLDVVSALHTPGLPAPTPGVDFDMPPADPTVPDTFRGPNAATPPAPAYGQHLGALSLAAALAVVVAALRGIHTLVQNRRANREQRQAVEHVAGSSSAGGSSTGRRPGGGRVQSGPEFGRTQLNRTNPGSNRTRNANGGPTGPSSNRSGSRNTGAGSNDKPGPHRKDTPHRKDGQSHKPNHRRKNRGPAPHNRDTEKHPKGPGVRRTSQGGTNKVLDRARRKNRGPDPHGPKNGRPGTKDRSGRRGPDTKRPKNKPGGKHHGKTTQAGTHKGNNGRTTLSDALHKEAERRMKLRRSTLKPPMWSAPNGRTKKPTDTAGKDRTAKTGPKTKTNRRGHWGKAQARARAYWQRRTGTSTTPPPQGAGPGPAGETPWDFSRPRATPWQAAAEATATATAAGDYTVTLERVDHVGDAERRNRPAAGSLPPARAALGPAPEKNFPRPGTRRPRPMPYIPPASPKENRVSVPASTRRPRRVPGMADQHQTEVTLDDVCNVLGSLTQKSFSTHDRCAAAASRAKDLRKRLLALANELAQVNNVTGQRTSAALARLAEDMSILARQAEAMSAESLHAAEATEVADTAMNDAYRPITQAAADAGLLAPSAPVHNQN